MPLLNCHPCLYRSHPVQDAEVTMYGCVTGTEATIKTNKTGYAASSGGVTYCGTHSDWGCSWTAHKGNTWYNPSQSVSGRA